MATVTTPEPVLAPGPVAGPVPTVVNASLLTPRLETGDRLTREQFEQRYAAEPFLKKAELLEGVVFMPSPVRQTHHSKQHFQMITWAGRYWTATPGIEGGDNGSLRLDLDNEPQPDGFLFIRPENGGAVKIDDEGYIVGAPEWIGEIAASSVSYDLHIKLHVYRRSGVREYMVWRVEDQAIDWFVLNQGRFDRLEPVDGVYRSQVFPGLWLNAAALIGGDLAKVAQIVDQGMATREHQEFVEKLRTKN